MGEVLAQIQPFVPPTHPFISLRTLLIFTLVVDVILGVGGLFIWRGKGGSPVVGFLWGFLMGLIGLLVVALATPSRGRKLEAEYRDRMLYQLETQTGAFEPAPKGPGYGPTPAELAALGAAGATPAVAAGTAAPVAAQPVAPVTGPARTCPHCRQEMQAESSQCPKCGLTSEPWWEFGGFWFTRNPQGQEMWFESGRSLWLLYRRTEECPSCGQAMAGNLSTCPACGTESNVLAGA